MFPNKITNLDVYRDKGSSDSMDYRGGGGSIGSGGGGDDFLYRLDRLESQVNEITKSLTQINNLMTQLDHKLDKYEYKFESTNNRFNELDRRLETSSKSIHEKIENTTKTNDAAIKSAVSEAKYTIILAIPTIIGLIISLVKAFSK
ncbi:TPA: hypothetical protein ACXYP7_000702 [Klebsiella pneumoniae]